MEGWSIGGTAWDFVRVEVLVSGILDNVSPSGLRDII